VAADRVQYRIDILVDISSILGFGAEEFA